MRDNRRLPSHARTAARHRHPGTAPLRLRRGAAGPPRHRRPDLVRRALRRPLRPARRRPGHAAGPAARDHRAVAPGRVRRHRAAGTRPGLVLADARRHGCRRAGLSRDPPGAGAPGAYPRGAGRPALAPGRPGLDPGPGLVAFRAAHPRRAARSRCRHRAPSRRRGPLAQHRRQPVRRAGLGHRGRADPQAAAPHGPDHDRPDRTCAVRAGDLPDRPARPARPHPRRGRAAARPPVPDRDPGPAPDAYTPEGEEPR